VLKAVLNMSVKSWVRSSDGPHNNFLPCITTW